MILPHFPFFILIHRPITLVKRSQMLTFLRLIKVIILGFVTDDMRYISAVFACDYLVEVHVFEGVLDTYGSINIRIIILLPHLSKPISIRSFFHRLFLDLWSLRHFRWVHLPRKSQVKLGFVWIFATYFTWLWRNYNSGLGHSTRVFKDGVRFVFEKTLLFNNFNDLWWTLHGGILPVSLRIVCDYGRTFSRMVSSDLRSTIASKWSVSFPLELVVSPDSHLLALQLLPLGSKVRSPVVFCRAWECSRSNQCSQLLGHPARCPLCLLEHHGHQSSVLVVHSVLLRQVVVASILLLTQNYLTLGLSKVL